MNRYKYSTMVEATNDLNQRGYHHTFKFDDHRLICLQNKKEYNSEQVVIDEQYRFEGMTNPSDNSIVFAVNCNDQIKGTVVSAYGPYANAALMQFMDDLKTQTV